MKLRKESIEIGGYYISDKTSFEELRNISHELFNYQSRIDFTIFKDYLVIPKETLHEDYIDNINNYEYFEYFSSILLMHINNVTFKTKYDKFYKFLEAPVYRIFNFDYDSYKYVYSPNIKKFVVNLIFDKEENGVIKFVDDPLLIETCSDIEFDKKPIEKNYLYIYKQKNTPIIPNFKNLLHEAYVGISLINITKKYLPNFSYTFCYAECSRPNINENKKVINWCNEEKDEYNVFPYVFKENIVGIKYSEYIKNCTLEEINILLNQYENALILCKGLFIKYENRSTNENNLIVCKLDYEIKIPIYKENKKYFSVDYETENYIKTDLILYITDFSDITIEYVSLGAEVTEYNTNTIQNKISNKKAHTFDDLVKFTKKINKNYEYKKLIGKKGQVYFEPYLIELDKKMYNQMDLYNNSCLNKKEKFETFENYISSKIENFKNILDNVNTKEKIVKICEEYILFLIYMKGSTCYNFIHYMDDMYKIVQNLTEKLKEYNYPLYLTNSLQFSLVKCYERLPTNNLFTKSNVISIFNMIKNLVMRICSYRLIYIISCEIYFLQTDIGLGTKILPLLIPSKEGLGVPISLFKTISSFFVKNVISKFLENYWVFLILLFIQLYPDILDNVLSLWDKSFEVLEYISKYPKYYNLLDSFSKKLEKQNDNDTWDVMKDDNEIDEKPLSKKLKPNEYKTENLPRLNNDKITKILKYMLNLSQDKIIEIKNKILNGKYTLPVNIA